MQQLMTSSAELGILAPKSGWLLKPDPGLFHKETSRPTVGIAEAPSIEVRPLSPLQSRLQHLIGRTPQMASPLDD